MTKPDFFSDEAVVADLKGNTIRGGLFMAVGQAGQLAIQLLSIPILARLLAPEDFGLIAMVMFVTNFARLFVDAGLAMATVQRAEITHQQVTNMFWLAVGMGTLLAATVAALAPAIAWFYGEPRLVNVTLVLAGTFILTGLTIQHYALLRRQMQYRVLAAIQIFAALFGQGGAILWAYWFGDYWALVVIPLAIPTTRIIIAWTFCKWRPGLPRRGSGAREMIGFGLNLTGFNLVNFMASNVDKMLIGWYWSATPLGYYERAFKLLLFPLRQVEGPASGVAVPALSRIAGEPARFRAAYLRIVSRMLIVMCPVLAVLGLAAHWCVPIILGAKWGASVPIFRWLALAGLTQLLTISVGWLLISSDRSRDMFRWGLIGSVPTLISFAVGLPDGPVGVARAFAISNTAIVLPLLFWWAGRTGPVTSADLWRSLVQIVPQTAAASIAVWGVMQFVSPESPMLGLLWTTATATIAWLVSAIATKQGRDLFHDVWSVLRGALGTQESPLHRGGKEAGSNKA